MPPERFAPLPVSALGIVIVMLELVGTLVTINFLSAKSAAPKLELVIALNVDASPNNIISPAEKNRFDGRPMLGLPAFVK